MTEMFLRFSPPPRSLKATSWERVAQPNGQACAQGMLVGPIFVRTGVSVGPAWTSRWTRLHASTKRAGSAICTAPVPRMTIALRFLAPITAPKPAIPAQFFWR